MSTTNTVSRSKKSVAPSMRRWNALMAALPSRLEALGVGNDAVRHAQPALADAWMNTQKVADAVERLARGADAEQALFDVLFGLYHLDENMPWLREQTDFAFRAVYGNPYESRAEQIDGVEFRVEEQDWQVDDKRRFARDLVDLRLRARAIASTLADLGLTGLEMDNTPRRRKQKLLRDIDRLQAATEALRTHLALPQPARARGRSPHATIPKRR